MSPSEGILGDSPGTVSVLAQELYETYSDATGWRSAVTSYPLPAWWACPPAVQDAWRAVAVYVLDRLAQEANVSYFEGQRSAQNDINRFVP